MKNKNTIVLIGLDITKGRARSPIGLEAVRLGDLIWKAQFSNGHCKTCFQPKLVCYECYM